MSGREALRRFALQLDRISASSQSSASGGDSATSCTTPAGVSRCTFGVLACVYFRRGARAGVDEALHELTLLADATQGRLRETASFRERAQLLDLRVSPVSRGESEIGKFSHIYKV